jgi:quinol monooxygenase YgiN
MIALLSRWQLKNGCPPELAAALDELTKKVLASEPGTLMYSVHLPASHPPIGPPPDYEVSTDPVTPIAKNTLVFFEVYRDADAFSAHLRGAHKDFMEQYRESFATPWQGHPRPEVTYLDPASMFVREGISARA